jgi:opacity protein-like surface antigen
MTRISLLFLIALLCAPAVFAQNQKDYSFYEFYVGYAYQRGNNNADFFDADGLAVSNARRINFSSEDKNFNGFTAEFNQNVTRNIGIVTSFTANFNNSGYADINSGRLFRASVQRYDLMIGPRYNWRLDSVTPFAHALFGFSHMRASFDDAITPQRKSQTAFAMAFGGGLDVHAGDHVDIRPIMIEYVPTFFNGEHQNNIRAGAGIKFK